MTDRINISKHPIVTGTVRSLPSSKSLSNRALIIQALLQGRGSIENLSTARDTRLMQTLLSAKDQMINAMDAGTTLRFLTAYFGVTGQSKTITGTERMKERPIHLLVVALREIGVDIEYEGKEGFPPLHIKEFKNQLTDRISIRGDVSSQFISALMLVAPVLPQGLIIDIASDVGSKPYLAMTAELMHAFGAKPTISDREIRIPAGGYVPASYQVEPDWSSASYWLSFAALAETANLFLPGVSSTSIQGDQVIVAIMEMLGVQSTFESGGLRLIRNSARVKQLEWNFKDCPDLAQTVLPACAALGISGEFLGLESLRIKETDRILALQQELKKLNAQLTEGASRWTLTPGKLPTEGIVINTYHDHRMAMGFAPLATRMDISIESPEVVEKSYPGFWEDVKGFGFGIRG